MISHYILPSKERDAQCSVPSINRKDNEGSDIESSPKRRKSYTATIVTCKESSHIYMYSLSFPISSKFTYVLVTWVGVNSRWGSIFSISLFDWGSIMIFVGWGSNQDWGSIRADTVFILVPYLNRDKGLSS